MGAKLTFENVRKRPENKGQSRIGAQGRGATTPSTAADFAALLQAEKPLDAKTLAKTFRQGAKAQPTIARVLASLARLGHVHSSEGKTFALRRAA